MPALRKDGRLPHWLYCKEHKTKWFVGSNLFQLEGSDQTEQEQRHVYDEIWLGRFTEVQPLPRTEPYERKWIEDEKAPF
jgi:hypothetical protein